MRVLPFSLLPCLPREKLPVYDCSDRIILHKEFCAQVGYVIEDMLCLTNSIEQTIYGTVFELHDGDKDAIYVPNWMLYKLDSLDTFAVSHAVKNKCKSIQIQPHSAVWFASSGFMPALNAAIINYHSLMKETRIPLLIGMRIEYVTIRQFSPSSAEACYVYNCGSVGLQVLSAFEKEVMEVAEAPIPFLFQKGRHAKKKRDRVAFTGRGFVLGGSEFKSDSPQAAAAVAAHRRLIKNRR
jgi:hypothetical protein